MSDIPYSVRDKSTRVNAIKGFNFDTLSNHELFKKQDSNNVTGTRVFNIKSGTSNTLSLTTDDPVIPVQVGHIKGEIDGALQKLHLSTTGDPGDGITITSQGRVGINIPDPEEDFEVDGSIQIDSANVARLKFQQSGQNPHALGEIDGEQDGTNGGDLQFYTKEDGGNVTEKLRINNVGAIGIGGANFGTTGQVLTSNGSTGSVSWESPIPYHLVIDLLPNSGTIYSFTSGQVNEINTLNVRPLESTATYIGDLTSSKYWSPSVSGIFQINIQAIFTTSSGDALAYSSIFIEKSSTGVSGTYTRMASSTDRRYGSSQNEPDAQAVVNTNIISQSFIVAPTDIFRIRVLAYTKNNVDPWLIVADTAFRMSITKIADTV